MNERENITRAVRFERPDHIPMEYVINDACWHHYPQDRLFKLCESHPLLFPGYQRPKGAYVPAYNLCAVRDRPFTDDFGCLWKTTDDGITGTVVGHPIKDWSDFHDYRFPDPSVCCGIGPFDWNRWEADIRLLKANGRLTAGSLRHGHTFLQLCDIRGYTPLMYDMFDEEPLLDSLIEKLEAFNLYFVRRFCEAGVDMICYPEDLGMQVGPMISPSLFRKYIKPSYERLMKPAKDKGIIIEMHSDGDIREIVDDLIGSGVDVVNLQDLVNGVDWIRDRYAGKTCIQLDIDRQHITVNGTPQMCDALLLEEVEKLASPSGGLMMIYGLYPGTPIENAFAVADAMEKYAYHFA